MMPLGTVKHDYQERAVARAYDRERFTGVVGRTFDALEKRTIRKLVRAAQRTIPAPTVLDCPCGTGRITRCLLDEGLQVVGGDISAAMLEVAQEKCAGLRVSFRQLDLDGLDL